MGSVLGLGIKIGDLRLEWGIEIGGWGLEFGILIDLGLLDL